MSNKSLELLNKLRARTGREPLVERKLTPEQEVIHKARTRELVEVLSRIEYDFVKEEWYDPSPPARH
jgi:hypothetical protein